MTCACTHAAAPAPIPAPTSAPVPSAPVDPTAPGNGPASVDPTGSGGAAAPFIVAGRSSTGTTLLAGGRHSGATPGMIEVVTPGDAPLVDAALAKLRQSPTGAPVLEAMQREGARIQVLDDAQFEALGHADAAAYYDPTSDTMSVRRTWLEQNPAKAASVIAHEGVHAVDDSSGLAAGALAARGGGTDVQAQWEVSVAKEARAFVVQGNVLRELGQDDPTKMSGAVAVAARGANDRATYDEVFRIIVSSPEGGYNPEGRRAEPFAL